VSLIAENAIKRRTQPRKRKVARPALLRFIQDMSQFSNALQLILDRHHWPQAHLARMAGLEPSNIHRYFTGQHRPRFEHLQKLIEALKDPEDKAALASAHLRDELPSNAAYLVRVVDLVAAQESSTMVLREEATPSTAKCTREQSEAIAWLCEHIATDPGVWMAIRSILAVIRKQ
jgi:transcriptional regulator with XRE-family HTH domain